MITSSHNPAEWNGVKYKASYGGSGKPSIITAIESYLLKPLPKAATPAKIEEVDFNPPYIAALEAFVDLDAIKASGYKFLIDTMYGAGEGYIAGIFTRAGIPFVEIRSEMNPAFPGINPEPILPHIAATQKAVVAEKCDAGLITDGDADRIGAVDEHGNVVDAHKIYAVLLQVAAGAQEVAGRCDARVQHDEDAGPHCGEVWAHSCMSMASASSMCAT